MRSVASPNPVLANQGSWGAILNSTFTFGEAVRNCLSCLVKTPDVVWQTFFTVEVWQAKFKQQENRYAFCMIDIYICTCVNKYKYIWTDGWKDRWMDGWIDK